MRILHRLLCRLGLHHYSRRGVYRLGPRGATLQQETCEHCGDVIWNRP